MPKLSSEQLVAVLEHHLDSIRELAGLKALEEPIETLAKIRQHVDEAEKLLEEAADQ